MSLHCSKNSFKSGFKGEIVVPRDNFYKIADDSVWFIVYFFYVITAAMVPVSELIGQTATLIILYVLQTFAVIAVTAVTTPAFVIADYYVYNDLTATRNAS